MTPDTATARAVQLMSAFAERTGLHPASSKRRRYLWTDAFAVCNFLELFARTGEERYRHLATDLIDQVHHVLGRYRDSDSRRGWISGLDEEAGDRHPTIGGLRIGKPLPERRPGDPIDEELEWERDGQYFHYLTKWMHALCGAAAVANNSDYARAALELANVAFNRFGRKSQAGSVSGIYWKMNTDLSYPLTPATGLHDALDGLITFREVRYVTSKRQFENGDTRLIGAITSLSNLYRDGVWGTSDALGIGGLLFDACRLSQLPHQDGDARLLDDIMQGCEEGIRGLFANHFLTRPISQRLAFRELGLAIGLKALPIILETSTELGARPSDRWRTQWRPLADAIVEGCLSQRQAHDRMWRAHQDINDVMLATALIPTMFLSIDKRTL